MRGDVLRKDLDVIIQDMVLQERAAADSAGSGGTTSSASGELKIKVVANLPYNITKDFLMAMLPKGDVVSELSIMIQEEAAQRLVRAYVSC